MKARIRVKEKQVLPKDSKEVYRVVELTYMCNTYDIVSPADLK